MVNKKIKRVISALFLSGHIFVSLTACTSENQNSNLSSDAATTTTAVQTPVPETTTTTVETEQTVSSATTVKTPAPETEQIVTSQTETPVPETATQITTLDTTVATAPAPEWSESEINGTKYVNTACYSRKNAVLGAETVKLYNVNDKVTVVAKTDTGYYKLDNGSFIHSDYLSDNKVVIATTTVQTTTPKLQTEAPVASDVEQIDLTVYSARPNIHLYLDVDCTDKSVSWSDRDNAYVEYVNGKFVPLQKVEGWSSFIEWTGTEFKVVEYIKSKDCYKREDGLYVKRSDVVFTDPVEAMYHYPFDFDAIKQYIIDDAVNNYGLVYNPDYEFEGSTWFPPTQVCKTTPPWILKRNIEGDEFIAGKAEASFDNDVMKAGDTFNVYIERVDLTDKKDEYGYDEGWLIYFLRGG